MRENTKITGKLTYYVFENLFGGSKIERYDTVEEALSKFIYYFEHQTVKYEDKTSVTLGVSIPADVYPLEVDIIHTINGEKYLVEDFLNASCYELIRKDNQIWDELSNIREKYRFECLEGIGSLREQIQNS